jgi:hypothetical protein
VPHVIGTVEAAKFSSVDCSSAKRFSIKSRSSSVNSVAIGGDIGEYYCDTDVDTGTSAEIEEERRLL